MFYVYRHIPTHAHIYTHMKANLIFINYIGNMVIKIYYLYKYIYILQKIHNHIEMDIYRYSMGYIKMSFKIFREKSRIKIFI